MKIIITIVASAILSSVSCEEVKLKDKFKEGQKYDVEVFYVNPLFGNPMIELRAKDGSLIDSKKINQSGEADDCEFFFYFDEKNNALDVCVNTGGPEWRWNKIGNDGWVLIEPK